MKATSQAWEANVLPTDSKPDIELSTILTNCLPHDVGAGTLHKQSTELGTKLGSTVNHCTEINKKDWSNWALTSLGAYFLCGIRTYKSGHQNSGETYRQKNFGLIGGWI